MYQIPFDVADISYQEACDILGSTKRFGIQPMLECVVDMNAELNNPDDCFESVQIAGTNGKTSTSRFAAQILMGEGKKVALYTSPELVSLCERMEIMGHPIAEKDFAHGIACAYEAGRRVNERRAALGVRPYDITEFDLITVAALVIFALAEVDVAVLECGMGGRWDATSATHNIKSVAITGIGLDHMKILGNTLEAIGAEKAAIIQESRTCVLGVGTATPPSLEDVFLERSHEVGVCPCLLRPERREDAAGEMHEGEMREHRDLPHASYIIRQRPRRLGAPVILDVTSPLGVTYEGISALKPSYQAANIACAIVLCEQYLRRPLDAEALFDSVVRCPTPGRFDIVRAKPLMLIDACHNPQGVQVFLDALDDIEPDRSKRPALLCAHLADKDVSGMVKLLAAAFPHVYVTKTHSSRALDENELAQLYKEIGAQVEGVFASVEEALSALGDQDVVALGSITTAGEVAACLRPGVQNRRGGDDITHSA
ncbi:MAG: bifunctional folylpolyglutamate synthase/dihydrofolate synthase [Atopobiaceae bacterium]|jgi:dihydrofolate synthase/folylpolyglutamate synthase